MAAKGCKGRGGYPHGKEYCGRRHGGGGAAKRFGAARVEKAYETIERRAGKEAIAEAVAEMDENDTGGA